MAVISMKQLLEAGVHFGHQTRRWNPKMAKYIFTERNGIHVIDLQQTVKMVDTAYEFVREAAAGNTESQEKIEKPTLSFTQDVWRRLKKINWRPYHFGF